MRIIGCKEYFSAADAGENWALGFQRWFFTARKSRDSSKIVVGTTVFQWRLELFRSFVPRLCLHRHCGDGFVAEARFEGIKSGCVARLAWKFKFQIREGGSLSVLTVDCPSSDAQVNFFWDEPIEKQRPGVLLATVWCPVPLFVASQHVCLPVVRIEFCRVCLLLDFSVQIHLIFSCAIGNATKEWIWKWFGASAENWKLGCLMSRRCIRCMCARVGSCSRSWDWAMFAGIPSDSSTSIWSHGSHRSPCVISPGWSGSCVLERCENFAWSSWVFYQAQSERHFW